MDRALLRFYLATLDDELITPIYIDEEFIGIVGHDVILDDIYECVLKNKFFESGYGFIFDENEKALRKKSKRR